MTPPAPPTSFQAPPHLTMDEYVTWIQAMLEQVDPVKASRQKALQEQITTPFRIIPPGQHPAVFHTT